MPGGVRKFVRSDLFVWLLYLAVAFAIYAAVLGGGPQEDDFPWFHNAQQRGILGNDHNYSMVAGGTHFWRPAVSVAFWAIWKLFGVNPLPFRLFNILLTCLTALAIRGIWLRITPEPRRRWTAVGAGVLFIVWPTHPETVAWIAGMTDGLAIALSAVGLWAYIVYRQSQRARFLAAALMLLVAGLLTKESAVPFPLIAFGLGSALIPWRKAEVKTALLNLLLLGGITVAYILLRAHVTGRIAGGYSDGIKTGEFLSALLGNKLINNLSNAFLPFGRYVWALNSFVPAVLACGVALFLRTQPRVRPIKPPLRTTLFILLAIWVCIFFYSIFYSVWLFILDSLDTLGKSAWAALALVLALTYMLAVRGGKGKRHLDSLKNVLRLFDPEIHRNRIFIFFAIGAVGMLYFGALMPYQTFEMLAVFLSVAYVTRPLAPNPSEKESVRAKYSSIALRCFVAASAALLPVLVVAFPVTVSGQWSRWSYAATVFSVMFLMAVLCCLCDREKTRKLIAAGAIGASVLLAIPNVLAWRKTGELSNSTLSLLRRLLPARRIYVLAAPGNMSGAGLLSVGLEEVPAVAAGDTGVEIIPLYRVLDLVQGDHYEAHRIDNSNYRIDLQASSSPRTAPCVFMYYWQNWESYFQVDSDNDAHIVHIKDFEPGDHVVIINTDGAVRLDR